VEVSGTFRRTLGSMWLTLLLLAVWELAVRGLVTDPRTALMVPAPSAVALAAWTMAGDGSLFVDIARSTGRVALGTLFAVLLGVPVGALVATPVGPLVETPLRLLRPIPPVAWVPLTILWFGVGELQQIIVLFFAAFHVVVAGVARAVRGVPAALVFAARNLGVSGVAWRVGVPAALPAVATAIREGVALAWFVLVAAEFLSASEGLGVLILEGRDLLEPARTFVGMGALAICGAGTDRGLAMVQARWTRWA
jgi:ABC-type nitrate/sulfonate/bicarbonate transport system permease component